PGPVNTRRGTTVTFNPEHEISGKKQGFKPAWLFQMVRSKAYLFGGVEIRWICPASLIEKDSNVPAEATFHFPNGLQDYLEASLKNQQTVTGKMFAGLADLPDKAGRVEFALGWLEGGDGFIHSYCNTIPTPMGGTHEQGLRTALSRSIRAYGDMVGMKKAAQITIDDIMAGAAVLLSVFIRDPQFQGQTKEKLATAEAAKWVDA